MPVRRDAGSKHRSPSRLAAWMLALATLGSLAPAVQAQDSRFTYQGQLKQNGVPVNATPDLEFRLFDQLQGGNQVGPTVTRTDVPVANGLFSVEVDFGTSAYLGGPRWIETRVEGQALSPRQAVNAVPIAAYALAGAIGTGSPTINFPADRLYAGVDLQPTTSTMFLLLSGITGGSSAQAGALDVLGYAMDATLPPPVSGGGGSAGRAVIGDLRVLVREDAALPTLYSRLTLGTATATARLDIRTAAAGGGTQPSKRICAETVFVTRISPLGRTGVVEIALAPVRIGGRQFTTPAGGPVQVASWGYDIGANTSWAPPTATCPDT